MPQKKSRQGTSSSPAQSKSKVREPNRQPTPSRTSLKHPLPRASVERAHAIFKNFSLSKFPKDALPPTHVADGKQPAVVQSVQRKSMTQQIATLNNTGTANPGMSLALSTGSIKQLLPSYDEKAGTIDLTDLLRLLTQKMKGTEFYSNGNPTLNRLALQTQVQQIIDSIKQGANQ